MDNNLNETEIAVEQNSIVQVDISNDSSVDVGVSAERSVIRGVDGFSPIATATQEPDGARITITDINGTTTAITRNGERGARGEQGIPGVAGADGFSPIATVSKSGDTATISITDKNGTTTASISDGTDGQNGVDGFSPSASVTQSGGVTTISITDKNGTTSESITIPTKTSQLTNNGADNTSTYVEASSLATVATTGSYPDLHNKPTIGNGTISIQKNSTLVESFTLNQSGNKTINISVPTKTSDLTNDGADNTSNYVMLNELSVSATDISSDISVTSSGAIIQTLTLPAGKWRVFAQYRIVSSMPSNSANMVTIGFKAGDSMSANNLLSQIVNTASDSGGSGRYLAHYASGEITSSGGYKISSFVTRNDSGTTSMTVGTSGNPMLFAIRVG